MEFTKEDLLIMHHQLNIRIRWYEKRSKNLPYYYEVELKQLKAIKNKIHRQLGLEE